MVYNGIGFNEEWAATKTEKQFIDQFMRKDENIHGLKKEEYQEAYAACKAAVKSPAVSEPESTE